MNTTDTYSFTTVIMFKDVEMCQLPNSCNDLLCACMCSKKISQYVSHLTLDWLFGGQDCPMDFYSGFFEPCLLLIHCLR